MNIQRFIANNGFGTNMYLVWDEDSKKAFIVDPGAESVQMENAISENKLQPEYIILTHAHGDHTGGIDPLKEKYPGIKLVANRAERKMLAERSRISGGEGHTADIEVTDGDTLDVGPMHLCFIDCPGHTPGGMSILLGKVLFSGDTLFMSSVGRTDLPGGDWDTLMHTIREKLFVLPDDTVVLPGHMQETTIGFEKRCNPFVRDIDK
ncbi:MAG: MBL fold metallo-hydrolase [Firmicutes bacterium]|nr:MBL fold metallo-hydrolase [Bacillota bacterium]